MTELRKLTASQTDTIASFFSGVFTKEPWNDDWSDKKQLESYILDLTGNPNSLALGLFEDDEMVGLSMGSIKHWYEGTQYCIEELCIKTDRQGAGLGKAFIAMIEDYIGQLGVHSIFLQTENNVPAYKFYKKCGFTELTRHVSLFKNT